MNHNDLRIGVIGGGNMGHAIVAGLLRAGHRPDRVAMADPAAAQRQRLLALSGDLQVGEDNLAVAAQAQVLVLAVKPQAMKDVVTRLAAAGTPRSQLVMSVAAGVPLAGIAGWLQADAAVVRVMPNQPALIGEGMSVLVASERVSPSQRAQATYVAEATGKAVWISDESLMDAVTALSGSGPAYFYLVIEMLEQSAVGIGLPPDLARVLTRQTALGAARVVSDPTLDVVAMRASVTSAGGTTAAAIGVMEQAGIRDIFQQALRAARDRGMELGRLSAR